MTPLAKNLPDVRTLAPTVADFKAWAGQKYEAELVQHLFGRYNVPGALRKDMSERLFRETGHRRMNLPFFCDTFSDFPVFLDCRKIEKIAWDSPVSKLFADFSRRAFVKEYVEMQNRHPEFVTAKPMGLIFFWPHLGGARGLVLHNRQVRLTTSGVRMVWVSLEQNLQLTLEPLPVFLDAIDADVPVERWLHIDNG
jgi:hypothetical protein